MKRLAIVFNEGFGNLIMLLPTLHVLAKKFDVHFYTWKKPLFDFLERAFSVENVTLWYVPGEVECFNMLEKHEQIALPVWHGLSDDMLASLGDKVQYIARLDIEEHETYSNLRIATEWAGLPVPDELEYFDDTRQLSQVYRVLVGNSYAPGWEKKALTGWPEIYESIARREEYVALALIPRPDENRLLSEHELIYGSDGYSFVQPDNWYDTFEFMLSDFDAYIGPDCGAAHLAAALGLVTIPVFGPTLPVKNMPLGPNVFPIISQMNCAPCQYTQRFATCQNNQCMQSVNGALVLNFLKLAERSL
jgi:hypothetical protein